MKAIILFLGGFGGWEIIFTLCHYSFIPTHIFNRLSEK